MTGVCMLSMPPGQVEEGCLPAVAIGRLPGGFNFAIQNNCDNMGF